MADEVKAILDSLSELRYAGGVAEVTSFNYSSKVL
jgi:hypothetical protein